MIRFAVLALVIVLGLDLAAALKTPSTLRSVICAARSIRKRSRLWKCPRRITDLGAQMAAKDNDTTGQFLNDALFLVDLHLKAGDDPATAVADLARQGISLIVADLPADDLLARPPRQARRVAYCFSMPPQPTIAFGRKDCRGDDVVHTAPSRRCWPTDLRNTSYGKMGALVSCRWVARARQAFRRGVDTIGEPFRCQNRSAAGIGHRRCSAHR